MFNKKVISATVATAFLASVGATTALAEDSGIEVSGNVALTSDYRFRGISQSDEDIAVQGGFDVALPAGFYIGTWGSSVDFGGGPYGSLELDYYAGWAGDIGDSGVGIDVAYYYYDYPGDNSDVEGDYQEFYIGASFMDATLGVTYSDDYYAKTDEFWYISGDYSFSMPGVEGLSVGLHAGYNMLDEDGGFLSNGQDEYVDYSVSLTYTLSGVDFTLAWVGTDLDEEDYFDTDLAEDTAVFTIARSL